jgi:CelD/BcsL family acetyltransferase involved in cellulose biosynthesis
MAKYLLRILDSIESFCKIAIEWNLLWERSNVTLPTIRAECIELWMRQFATNSSFRTLIVEIDGNFVAGIPLYRGNKVKPFRTGMLTNNDWTFCGDLLLDSSVDADAVWDTFFEGIDSLPYDLLWLDSVRFDQPQWKQFREYLQKTGRQSQWLPRYTTGVVSLSQDRETLLKTWNKNELKDIRRRLKKWYLPDSYSLQVLTQPAELQTVLPQCFALEDAGWKGVDGGSILKCHLSDYFTRLAMALTANGQFRLYVLYFEENIIAFRYTFYA